MAKIEDAKLKSPTEDVIIDGHKVEAQHLRSGTISAINVHENELSWFKEHLSVRPVPAGYLRAAEAANYLKTKASTPRFQTVWKELKDKASVATPKDDGSVEVVLENHVVKLGEFQRNRDGTGGSAWYLSEESLPELAKTLGREYHFPSSNTFASRVSGDKRAIDPDSISQQKKKRAGWSKSAEE